MKKFLLCSLLLIVLTGCNQKETVKEKEDNPEVEKSITINLNDNVYYYADIELSDKDCGGFGFPSNVEKVLDDSWYSLDGDMKVVDKMELFMHDNITFDQSKEDKAKKEWDKLKKPERGVSEFSLGYYNHVFYFGYWYINLAKDEDGNEFDQKDNYYELAQTLKKERTEFNNKAYSIIKENDGYRLQGTCGGPAYEMTLLDEEACNKYNLNCERW